MSEAYVKVDAGGGTYEEREFRQVRILDSGWLKCTPDNEYDLEKYYPPERVLEVSGRVYTGDGGER